MVLGDVSTNDTLIICTTITAIPATLAAVVGWMNRQQIKTPSGDTLGAVAERTHDLAAVTAAHTTALVKEGHEDK